MVEGRFCSLCFSIHHLCSPGRAIEQPNIAENTEQSEISRMGGRKIPGSFRDRMHIQEDAATLTYSRYLCKREGTSFSLVSRLMTMLLVSTGLIPPALVSAKPHIKSHSEQQFQGSANSGIYINQSSTPYNHSAIRIIPVDLSSDPMTCEISTTGGQYRTLSYISLISDFHRMRMKMATGDCKSCQISTSLLSEIADVAFLSFLTICFLPFHFLPGVGIPAFRAVFTVTSKIILNFLLLKIQVKAIMTSLVFSDISV